MTGIESDTKLKDDLAETAYDVIEIRALEELGQ